MIDASVAFKWLIPDAAEDDVPAAKALLADHMEGKAKIVIPSLQLEVVSPTLVSANVTLRLASLHGLSYYDATYVALAGMLDCPLITADRRLAERARATGHVRLLGK